MRPPRSFICASICASTKRRVGHRAAERSGMQIGAAAAQVDLEVHQTAQAVADRRHAAREHRRVGDDDDVGAELVLVRADEVVEVGAADFLFALEDELDVHRQARRSVSGALRPP